MAENFISKIQSDYIINNINKLNLSKSEKLKILDMIINDLRNDALNELDKAV
ncbi:MAG: hypothetical protein ACI4VF_03315 [Lachnospirales bacterium]